MRARFSLFALAFFAASVASASKLVIVSDQPKAIKARDIAALFRATPPYSLMKDLSIKVIQTSTAKLGCQSSAPSAFDVMAVTTQDADADELLRLAESRDRRAQITRGLRALGLPPSCSDKGGLPTRLITCDSPQSQAYLAALKRTEKANYVVVVKDDARYGGSGGPYPVVTSGSPSAMAIHELMHRLGFADEYGYYTPCEADIYCPLQSDTSISPSGYGSLPATAYNVTLFNERARYASNADVRKAHAKNVPWLASIDAKTDLISAAGKLGTPAAGKIGIYRAIVCDKASQTMESWQSTSEPTIMKTLGTTYIPKNYWPIIAKSLGTHITEP